jgi:thiosulfate/3-mercaptopyruvate sulfurtransferase
MGIRMSLFARRIAICTALVATAVLAGASFSTAPNMSLLVSTDWLAKNLKNSSVVILVVDRTDSAYRAGHVPGARFVPYATFGQTVNGISLELPTPDSLQHLFESVGVSNASHVILTGRPLIVTRAFYTLDYLGLKNVSALDGGFTKWHHEGRAVENATPEITRGHITPAPRPEIVAKAPWVLDRIGKPGYSFVDTRTDSEYIGIGARGGLKSTGHIDGARRLEWQTAFTDTNDFTPKSIAELSTLWRERVVPGDTVVSYCYIGYRASGTYFISRLLGYPAKLYDGSYDEWAQLKYPTVTEPTPLRKP